MIVLDRPNPINGIQLEGNCLCADVASFVGRYPIPMRHGLTMGEYASYINATYAINCRLTVIPMSGWRRAMYFTDTGLPWVAPSPNLPTPASAVVYPGQVIWEGTNVSEGRAQHFPLNNSARLSSIPGRCSILWAAPQFPAPFSGRWGLSPRPINGPAGCAGGFKSPCDRPAPV